MMNYTAQELFELLNLNDPQKQALIFVREVGAFDNQTYRQMADCDTLKASTDLRMLKLHNLFASKGKSKATYYISGPGLNTEATDGLSTQALALNTQPPKISTPPHDLGEESDIADIEINTEISTPPLDLSTPPLNLSAPPPPPFIDDSLQKEIDLLNRREHNPNKIKGIIKKICKERYLSARQISGILNKGEDYIKRKYLSEMIKDRDLIYLHAEMINHPEQAYMTNEK